MRQANGTRRGGKGAKRVRQTFSGREGDDGDGHPLRSLTLNFLSVFLSTFRRRALHALSSFETTHWLCGQKERGERWGLDLIATLLRTPLP